MTLDEAIERYTSNAEYERTHVNLQGYLEFKQLAEWLKELKENKDVLDKIRAEIIAIAINGQIDEHTMFVRTAEQVKQMALNIIDKYKTRSEE